MNRLFNILQAIQKIADDFEGSISIKNASRQYFYVNDAWLNTMRLSRENVSGKTDDEILPAPNAAFVKKTDQEALEKGSPVEYIHKTQLNGKEIEYIAIKWVITFKNGSPFCYCTVGDLMQNKEKVLSLKSEIQKLFKDLPE